MSGEERFPAIVTADPTVLAVLEHASSLGVGDWWLTAGVLRGDHRASDRCPRVHAPCEYEQLFALIVRPNRRLAPRHVYDTKAARSSQQ